MNFPSGTKLPRRLRPEVLMLAIESFKKLNPEYRTKFGATDHCFIASADFIGHLDDVAGFEAKADVRQMLFCYEHSFGHYCSDFDRRIRRVHRYEDFPLIKRVNFDVYMNHAVVIIGNLHIDFTARQFDEDAEWPFMWVKPAARKRLRRSGQSSEVGTASANA